MLRAYPRLETPGYGKLVDSLPSAEPRKDETP
jgi:hypothetical protein